MRVYTLAAAAVVAVAATTMVTAPAMATGSHQPKNHKVGICHSTGSQKNPYVFIVVDKHAAAAHAKHHDGRDIIGVRTKSDCKKKAATAPTPTPAPQVLGDTTSVTTLPEAGGGLMAALGTTAMGGASLAYLRSRRSR